MNELQIFKNKSFGKIRIVMIDEEPWLVGKDVAEALGYQNPSKALSDHVEDEDKLNNESLSSLGQRGGWLINESGFYSLVMSSKLESAREFKHWVTSEVLPSIRKTGKYSLDRELKAADAEVKLGNMEARMKQAVTAQAKLWMQIADATGNQDFRETALRYAAKTLAGDDAISLPEAPQKTYSAAEIGEMLGISANMVGRLANQHHLKTDEYGKLFYDKSPYSDRQVESFRYYENVLDTFRDILEVDEE